MTAAGIAVAIPAVLAYNLFGKWIAACEAELEGFAHDLREMVLDADGAGAPPPAGMSLAGLRPPRAAPRTRRTPPMSDINMTPLIDVMLVLLVIFIITAPLMTSSLKLDLPKAEARSCRRRAGSFMALAIDAEGRCSWATSRCRAERWPSASRPRARAVRARTRPPRCSCAPTSAVPYGRVAELIGWCRRGLCASASSPSRAPRGRRRQR
jgi:biopolymer transport protein TolR